MVWVAMRAPTEETEGQPATPVHPEEIGLPDRSPHDAGRAWYAAASW